MKKESTGLKEILKYSLCIGLIVICIGILFAKDSTQENNLVIGFFGILATFVVIGNFTQVSHIIRENKDSQDELKENIKSFKEEVENRLREVQTATMYDDGTSKIQKLLNFMETYEKSLPEIKKQTLLDYQKNIEEINQEEFSNIIEALVYLTNGPHRLLVNNILNNKLDVKYSVIINNAEQSVKAIAAWADNRLIFKDSHGDAIEGVSKVSNKPFDSQTVCRILAILLRSQKPASSGFGEASQSVHDWIYEK